MCGIAGCLTLAADERIDVERVWRMTEALRHRGPDGGGMFAWPSQFPRIAFGIRRLAILDLQTGDQPVFSEDGRIAVVSNGEIYNYVELRRELAGAGHVFRSTGDTEVLVHLYEEHGLELFGRLRGMYAFALWDSERQRLVLAVDHLGIKPLYLCAVGSQVLFGSEVKALLTDPRVGRRLRVEAVDTYVTFGYAIGEDTLFDGIERVPPATACVFERGRKWRLRHWTPPAASPSGPAMSPETAVRDELTTAVRLHLQSDVPLGLFLSGGVDSAGLAALMRAENAAMRTFTVGYAGASDERHDEASEASRVAAWAGAEHSELRLSPSDWWNTLTAYVVAHDEPNANASMISLHALAQVASRSVKVVLNGTGGDELFGGYPAHTQLPAVMRRNASIGRTLPALSRRFLGQALGMGEPAYPVLRRWPVLARVPNLVSGMRAAFLPLDEGLRRLASFEALVLTDHQRRQLYDSRAITTWLEKQHAATAYRALLSETRDAGGSNEDIAQRLVMRTWLPGNGLLAIDKVTMAHGLEARVPYFDRALVERVMSLPASIRLQAGKGLLRAALEPQLPEQWRVRRKQSFETPLRRWIDHDLAGRIREVLLDPGARISSVVSPRAVERLLFRHHSRRVEQAELIFRLLILELWWRSVLER